MKTNRNLTKNLRGKTDKSLSDERGKTDEHLERKSKVVESETTTKIRLNRASADKVREKKRAAVDSETTKQQPDAPTQAEEKSLDRERARSDEAQKVEREQEDRARAKERSPKKLLAEAYLEQERKETDPNLRDERVCFDSESEDCSKNLSAEKVSHQSTKAALVSRDQFLAIVSYDLRNHVATISIGADLIRKNLSKAVVDIPVLLKCSEIIERSGAIMDRMIGDLLDVERIANNKLVLDLERIDLCALLQECIELFAPVALSKSFTMTIQSCPEGIFASADHDRVLQVLSNLMGNALKFTPNGGAISLSLCKQGSEVEISVADNGPGIPAKKKLQIFERFSQLKAKDRRGLGLGLYISKWIVEAHKGNIPVDSEPGKGSVFKFTLPLETAP